MEPRILVVGEALVDIVDGVEIVGGSPANVALGLGRLGEDVELLTALAPDERGLRIVRHLEDSGVTVLPESFSLERTSTATAAVGADGSAEYEFDIAWELNEVSVDGYDIVHVGSIACFLEPGAAQVLRTAERAAAGGAMVTFDPNFRESIVASTHASKRARMVAERSAVIKLSDEDAQALFPDMSERDLVSHLLDKGLQLVAITRGAAGSSLATAADCVEVEVPQTTVVDTVGAGDTFMAALISSLAQRFGNVPSRAELAQIGVFCSAAAALTVSRRGADLPTRSEVERAQCGQ